MTFCIAFIFYIYQVAQKSLSKDVIYDTVLFIQTRNLFFLPKMASFHLIISCLSCGVQIHHHCLPTNNVHLNDKVFYSLLLSKLKSYNTASRNRKFQIGNM